MSKYQVNRDMTEIEYQLLKESIAEFGVLIPVEIDRDGNILDGHHRVKACEELGIVGYPTHTIYEFDEDEKKQYAQTVNDRRRHLSKEELKERMIAMKQAGESLRTISDATGLSPQTIMRHTKDVGVPNGTTTGKDGKQYPARKPKPISTYSETPPTAKERATTAHFLDDLKPEQRESIANGEKTLLEVKEELEDNTHVKNNSGNNNWYTPHKFIESARLVMGGIDCDPASSDIANRTVQAATYYTVDNNGLDKEWRGNVWMNPPYSKELIGKFTGKLIYELGLGNIFMAIILVNNATETKWFQDMLRISDAICFPSSRVKFLDTEGNPNGSPLQGQAILYFGVDSDGFCREFSQHGLAFEVRSYG